VTAGPVARRVAVACLLTVALAGCGSGDDAGSEGSAAEVSVGTSAFHGATIQQPYPLPAETFTTTSGTPVELPAAARTPVTLVFFGYTHCPDVCNVVLANLASALRRSDAKVRSRTTVLFVSTDPDRDTASTIRQYLDRFDPRFVGLRAPEPTMKAAAAAMHIAYAGKDPASGGGYDVSHGTQVTAFRDGKARVVWMAETSVKDLRADLARLAVPAEPAS
jgi:protein SCO1/2